MHDSDADAPADAPAGRRPDAPAEAVRTSRVPLTANALAALAAGNTALAALAVTATSASTNTDLLAALDADPEAWPHMSALVADHQTAGRGRAGREWLTPQGAALTVSVVLRPTLPRARWGLIPLVVGVACVKTLAEAGLDARLKWPNDVVVASGDGAAEQVPGWGSYKKVAGILCEAHSDAVVAGIGINVSQAASELPVAHAASMASLGAAHLDRTALLDALTRHVAAEVAGAEHDADAFVTVATAVTATIGMDVVAELAAGAPVTGRAVGIAPTGALIVLTAGGERVEVHAGDVRLRISS